jgi:hypothetical protein
MKMIGSSPLTTASACIIFAAILTVYTSFACAADEVPDVTMSVLESEADAERVVSEIQLPEKASPVAREHSAKGLETANAARERRQEAGQENSDQAREHSKPGKSDEPGRPGKPEHPGKPDNPGKPDKP